MVGKPHTKCPECGNVQPWDMHGCRAYLLSPQLRCSIRNCRARWHVLHDHVLFTTSRNSASLEVQSQVIFNFCAKVSQASTHLQLNLSHCAVESIYGRCRDHLAGYVLEKHKHIVLGVPGRQVDVEADEITFAKRAVEGGVTWTQYLGLVRRGSPETLVLIKLPDRVTASRAPCPGPLLSEDWKPIADKYCSGQNMILNTDSARAYELRVDGTVHTRVCHAKKKIGGKWVLPVYAERDI
eukprot:5477369-Amphidinium_carterae.1